MFFVIFPQTLTSVIANICAIEKFYSTQKLRRKKTFRDSTFGHNSVQHLYVCCSYADSSSDATDLFVQKYSRRERRGNHKLNSCTKSGNRYLPFNNKTRSISKFFRSVDINPLIINSFVNCTLCWLIDFH